MHLGYLWYKQTMTVAIFVTLTNGVFLGFRALSEAYLDAAKATEEGTKEDTEELYLLAARMVRKINIRV